MANNVTTNPVQLKIDELVEEREKIFKDNDILHTKVEQNNMRLCEINGAIQVLVEMFGKKPKEGADDTESKADSESDTDER